MTYKVFFCTVLLSGIALAQVASHAPTTVASAAPRPAVSAQASPMVVTDKPVARVNGAVLTDRDLLREMFSSSPTRGSIMGSPKSRKRRSGKGRWR